MAHICGHLVWYDEGDVPHVPREELGACMLKTDAPDPGERYPSPCLYYPDTGWVRKFDHHPITDRVIAYAPTGPTAPLSVLDEAAA